MIADRLLAWSAAVAVRVQVLPDVIGISIIPTLAGLGSLAFAFLGAVRGFDPDRLARVALFGTLLGGCGAAGFLLLALLLAVLS